MASSDGALQLKALGVRLKALGADAGNATPAVTLGAGRSLRAQLIAGIRAGSAPAVAAARQAARDQLPQHGGLNDYVADTQIVTSTRTGGRQVGVRIGVKRGSHKAYGANKGLIRHPVFGKSKWVDQKISSKGWFDDTLQREAPKVEAAIYTVMQQVAVVVTRRGF